MKLTRYGLAIALALGLAWGAEAQQPNPSTIATLNPSIDLIPDVYLGIATPQTQYTTPAAIAGVPAYTDAGVGLTGGTYTFKAHQTNYFMRPAGTLAAITLTTEANPADGQRECFLSTQTTSSLTWNANTGQTMGPTITAGVANTALCITYESATATWQRSP